MELGDLVQRKGQSLISDMKREVRLPKFIVNALHNLTDWYSYSQCSCPMEKSLVDNLESLSHLTDDTDKLQVSL